MKNQYVGDIGDYGKYSLLRFLAIRGIKIGINWCLTENDGTSDGRYTDYLKKENEKDSDPVVYTALQGITKQFDRNQRTVQMIQEADLIPNALFFNERICSHQTSPLERAWERRVWFENSKRILQSVDLLFSDPDNGVTYTKTSRIKGSDKYILPEEIAQYYYEGKNVVFYCHKGRRTKDEWERTKTRIKEYICDAGLFVLTFHRGTQRSYIFVVHPEKMQEYTELLTDFVFSTAWRKHKAFECEDVNIITVNSTSDICRRSAVLNYFQNAFRTKREKEIALNRMTNEQIDELIAACFTPQAKSFYNSFKKSELMLRR